MDLLQEYSELKKTIDYHMDRYYNQDEPEISDYEYDKLMIRLKEIEKEHPEWVTSDSPSQKIGGTVKREAGVKVTHNVPMLSIEDVFSEDAVCAWIDKVHAIHPDCTFSVETKIDGLSMSLRYVKEADGKLHLQLAETRGDGLIGEDVTANARVVGDVLQVIDLPYDSLELRGEVYMSHEDFEKYNAILIGCGLGLSIDSYRYVIDVFSLSHQPLVIDADALTILSSNLDLLKNQERDIILTPHMGEFKRLCDVDNNDDMLFVAKEFARKHQVVLVLKGPYTIVTDGQEAYRVFAGNKAMATGGMGDVLAGMITSLLGQGYAALNAAVLGVYIHGYAGDRIAEKHYTVIPSVLIERIPQSMNEIKKSNLEKITCVE